MPLLETLSGEHGVGPVCHELDIAPSTYYWHHQRRKYPERRSCRDKRDAALIPEILRVYEENYSVYGVRKVWWQLKREGVSVARCTIERLMKARQIRGVTRGKNVRTTRSSKTETPQDRVNRQFVAERPDLLWVADFTYGVPGVQGGHGCSNEPRVCLEYCTGNS
jgi:putative transposase